MATGILLDFGRFYWNIDAHVGIGCPNKAEDVQLVQLAFHCRANNPKIAGNKEEQAIFSAVIPGAPYNGAPADPLSIAIKYAQKQRGGVQDGRVSRMKPEGLYAPGITWMLVGLNNNMVDILGGMWPFLDRHPKCTPALKELVKRTFHVVTNNN